MINSDVAEKLTGKSAPRSFVLDASVLEMEETHEIVREDVKRNRIEFVFPSGLNKLSLFEECRALTMLKDFETMFDVTMQLLVDKDLIINITNDDGSKTELCAFHIVDRFQDLRGVDAIDEYPVVVTWLTEFIGVHLTKKYPLPGRGRPQVQTATKKAKSGKQAYPTKAS